MSLAISSSTFISRTWFFAAALLIVSGVACSKDGQEQVVIDMPANFIGQVHIEMGVPGAPALQREGSQYRIPIPPDGKLSTSSVISDKPFHVLHVEHDHLWGYASNVNKTGDGVAVGGTIEFFVGSKEQYETSEARKHKTSLDPTPRHSVSHSS